MTHLGDITKLNGAEIPVVDVITGGSPCQDLSVAGKRAGLAGERSGLFMEQIRIVKEMREQDARSGRNPAHARPRYMVWENVPGAFSSGNPKGADFAAVLEEIIKVAEPGADVCVCVPDGGWTKSGCYYAEDGAWSIAWRLHDAQFWGVPQRRKRIALVADFGGLSAPEVLFERKGLRKDPEKSAEQGQGASERIESGAGSAIGSTNRGFESGSVAETLRADSHGALPCISFQERAGKPGGGKGILIQDEHVGALSTVNNQSVLAVDLYNQQITGDVSASLTAACGGSNTSGGKVLCLNDQGGSVMDVSADVTATLRAQSHVHEPAVAYGISAYESNSMKSDNPHSGIYEADTARTLDLNGGNPACNQGGIAVVQPVLRLNDQGGALMDVSHDVTGALRAQEHGHQPLVVGINGQIAGTLDSNYFKGCGERQGVERDVVCVGNGQLNQISMAEQANTLDTMHDQQAVIVFDKEMYNCGERCTGSPQAKEDSVAPTCRADDHPSGVAFNSVVRRLTPLECERLQGYPDGWTDIGDWLDSKGKKHKASDSPRYKALGNSIALPFWFWLLRRISAQYERPATLGSLFDGIGGFPLCWERCNGKGTALWASEIEEFPIAVTKIRFSETKGAAT